MTDQTVPRLNFPQHITPHLIAVRKHPRPRRRKILMWAARCNRINAEKMCLNQSLQDRYNRIAQEQEDAAQWALSLAFGEPKNRKPGSSW